MRILWPFALSLSLLGGCDEPRWVEDEGAGEGEGEGEGEGPAEGEGEGPAEGEGEGPAEGEGEGPTGDTRLRDFCQPCGRDTCPPGGPDVCLLFRGDGRSYCLLDCGKDGVCPIGSRCMHFSEGRYQCIPTGDSCEGWEPLGWPSTLGVRCSASTEDDVCTETATHCVDEFLLEGGYCTQACDAHGRCPAGFSVCRDGWCRADWEVTPAACGAYREGPGRGCDHVDPCDDGEVCLDDLVAGLPESVSPFCTRTCEAGGDCPDGTTCARTGLADDRLCVPPACGCLARSEEPTLLETALDAAGVDPCDARISESAVALYPRQVHADPWRLSWFNRVHRGSLAAVPWAREVVAAADGNAASPTPLAGAIEDAAARLDVPILAPRPAVGEECDLVEALAGLWEAADDEETPDREALAEETADLPETLGCKLARIVRAIGAAHLRRTEALEALPRALHRDMFDHVPGHGSIISMGVTPPNLNDPTWTDILDGVTFRYEPMYTGARDLAAVIEAQDLAAEAGGEGFSATVKTPLGLVAVRDAQDHVYDAAEERDLRKYALLLVDTGGNDTYRVPVAANASFKHSVSVHLDLAGDDAYGFPVEEESEDENLLPTDEAGRYTPGDDEQVGPLSLSKTARQGGGRVGIALHFDLAGDDTYLSHKMSQGYGILGVGAVVDRGGSDTYQCEQACQGGGAYGIGLLLDLGEGDDRYLAFQHAQGYGYTRGLGLLYDGAGNDTYTAVVANPREGEGTFLYPSAQNPDGGSNSSMAQGAGRGRRGDTAGDYVYQSGGLGVLRDAGPGTDAYTVDIFGQATGFWFGAGILADGGGDDTYDGRWYNQGSNAHMALAVFLEEGGNDRYNQSIDIMATAVGQGHDLSVGWLVDYAGDDVYTAPGLGLGGGNDNGLGFLVDFSGADLYDVPAGNRTYGGAGIGGDPGPRWESLCLGVFIDAGGEDDYTRAAESDARIGNDRTWSLHDRHGGLKPGEHGAGLDASGGEVGVP